MAGEIKAGDKFGTYSGMINDFSKKYRPVPGKNAEAEGLQSKYNFFDKENGMIKANGSKEKIRYTDYNTPRYANSVIFHNGFTFGTSAKDEAGLDTFDYVLGKNQFALDYDGDGEVDNDEIIDGKFDMLPRGAVKYTGSQIDASNMTHRFIQGRFLKNENGKLTSYVANMMSIPLTFNFEIEMWIDNIVRSILQKPPL